MRRILAPSSLSLGSLAVVVGFVLGAFGGSAALAQCVIEYDADVSPPVVFGGGSGQAVVRGTFNCGIVAGTLCGLGTYSGDCTTSTNTASVVSCNGACDVIPESNSVTCDGAEAWRGETTGTCAGALCVSDGHGVDGTTSHSIVVADADTLTNGLQDCGFNGAGISHTHYIGTTTIPLPIP